MIGEEERAYKGLMMMAAWRLRVHHDTFSVVITVVITEVITVVITIHDDRDGRVASARSRAYSI